MKKSTEEYNLALTNDFIFRSIFSVDKNADILLSLVNAAFFTLLECMQPSCPGEPSMSSWRRVEMNRRGSDPLHECHHFVQNRRIPGNGHPRA